MASLIRGKPYQGQEDEIWALCKELEELGGGIRTRLETVAQIKL